MDIRREQLWRGQIMTPRRTKLLVSLVTLSVSSLAGTFAAAQTQAVPQPAPEMQSLTSALAGTWRTSYSFAPRSPGTQATTGHGEETWRRGPGGFTLLEEEHISTASGDEFLLALHWWDKSTNSLRGMLCNNSGPATCNVDSYANSTLKWNGQQLVIDMQFPEGSKRMLWHEVWSDITASSFTQTGDMGEVGGTLQRVVTIHGARAPAREKDSSQ
jgi:hypothetical protein